MTASLEAIAQWFDALVENSSAGIGVISVLDNRYVRANAALGELYGMSLDELLRTDPFSMALRITHPDELVAEQKLFAELIAGARRFYRIEKRFMRPDGSMRVGLLTLSGMFEPAPDSTAAVGPMRWATVHVIDVTEHKALAETLVRREAEFRHAQKIDALGRLAAGIAHDFNNLLTVITGHGEFLRDLIADPSAVISARELEADLGAILEAAERAAGLTAQLLAHGRRSPAAPRAFVLSELAAALQGMLWRTLGSDVEIEQALEAKAAIFADQGQIGQVVMNLMLNARDALAEGGRIRLATRDVVIEAGAAGAALPGPGAWVALIVADNGQGMSLEVQARMFEPFFTTRVERPGMQGSGLGLATVQRIVEESGGRIAVESAEGEGTTVTVYFPRAKLAPDVAAAPSPSRAMPVPNSRRVLVVEDEPSIRSLVGTVLLGAHYRVSVACDGEEGLRVLDAEREPFHLIVTDLMMPRVGGMSLAKQLHARGGTPPRILFITGYSHHSPAELAPYGQLLLKPFTPAQLLSAVEQALADSSAPKNR